MSSKLSDRIGLVEARIIRKLVIRALDLGYLVGVNDGEELALKPTKDRGIILPEVGHTGETYLIIARENGEHVGMIWLIHGNEEDVVSDHTDNEVISSIVSVVS